MTNEDIERVANEMRLWLQERSCCPGHASQVCMTVLAGMALDHHNDDRHKAAAEVRRVMKGFVGEIERGKFTVVRSRQ